MAKSRIDSRTPEATQSFRYPLFASVNFRGIDEGKDQRFVNCFPEALVNQETGAKKYYMIKRAGYSLYSTPKGAGGVGRGLYSWNGKVYSVIDNGIYSGTTNIGTIGTSTGWVSLVEMSSNAGTPYLCLSDGSKLYLISTTDVVTTIDNTQVQSASITNAGSGGAPASGTWATSGGGGAGATGTFTITGGIISAVTVTTRGSGYTSTPTITISTGALPTGGVLTANLCAFPPNNLISIKYFDGYIFAATAAGRIYNCDVGQPTIWQPSNYLSAEMFPDDLVGLARQNNMLVAFGDNSTQFFYDAANATGSPLANAEQAVLQVGSVNAASIMQQEQFVTWVAKGDTGGYFIYRLDGLTNTKKISTEPIERILNREGAALATCRAFPMRYQGHFFYVLQLTSRTILYDFEEDVWHEWEDTDGSKFPMVESNEFGYSPLMLHASAGKIFKLDETLYQDNGTPFTVTIQTSRIDMETMHRKFMWKFELVGDSQSTSSPISVQYSDDDYNTWSTARTLDLNNIHNFLHRLGSFRRRAFRLMHTVNTPLRLEAIEVEIEQGDY